MKDPERILLIRFSSIGDIILTSALVSLIHRDYPNSEIHYATKESYASAVELIPGIHRIHKLGSSFSSMVTELKNLRFSSVIDLHNNLRSRRLCRAIGSCDGRLRKLNISKWLLVNFKINRLPQKHIVERYIDAASCLRLSESKEVLSIKPGSDLGDEILNSLANEPFVVFSLGATHNTKRMEVRQMIQLCKKISKRIVLAGGADTVEIASELEGELDNEIINLNGLLNLPETTTLLERSAGVIGFDTGIMHMASALQKKVCLIWGNTVQDFGMGPFQPGNEENIHNAERFLPCRPCSKIGYARCPKGHFKCMREQDLETIASVANSW